MSNTDSLFSDDGAEYDGGYDLTQSDFSGLYVIPSDWTVSTLKTEMSSIVDLSPSFQRRSVWNQKAKSKFIESLILGIPIPQILLAENKEIRNQYLILDGKQRLTSIKEFFEEEDTLTRPMKLTGLQNLKELNGKTWKHVKDYYPDLARSLESARIRTAIITGWSNDNVLYEIFHRLNSGSVKLSPMELRMSLIRGPFVKEIITESEKCTNLLSVLGLTEPDKRMRDVEIAIRYLAFLDGHIEYKGVLKDFLDSYCRLMNNNFDNTSLVDGLSSLEKSIALGIEVFGLNYSRKFHPSTNEFEKSFNRAIFDVISRGLSFDDVAVEVRKDHGKFIRLYKSLFNDSEFVSSVTNTTKSIKNTRYRFTKFTESVRSEYSIDIGIPNITEV